MFAKDVADALNETHETQKMAIRKQVEGFLSKLNAQRSERSKCVQLFAQGEVSRESFAAFEDDVQRREDQYVNEIERLNLSISDGGMDPVKKVFELAINARELYISMNREERLECLKRVCSNPTLDGLTLRYQLEKPFARLASWRENSMWRTRVDDFITECLELAA